MTRLIQALAIVAIGAVAQGCVHHNHGTRRVVVQSEPVAYTSSIDYRYHGYHPVPHAHGGGWCNLDQVHVHHYEPLVSYGYTYHDSYNYWVYSRPRVIYYYGGHYDHHGRFCNHRGRHSHDYLPSRHAASAYTWDSGRRSYVYAPDSRSRAVRGVRATPPPGQGVGRAAPRPTRSGNEVPRVSPGSAGSVRSASPRSAPATSPGTAPRVSPNHSVNTPQVAPRTPPPSSPRSPSPASPPAVAPRSSPGATPPVVREAPRASPRTSPDQPPAPAAPSAPSPTPRAARPGPSARSAPAASPAPSASPRSTPSVSRPSSPAPSRSTPAPSRPVSRPQPRR